MDETPPRAPGPFDLPPDGGDILPPPVLEALAPPAQPAPVPAPSPGAGRFEEWLDLLNNRLVLGALGLVTVLLLTAIVFLAIGHGNAGPNRNVFTGPTASAGTARPLGGLSGRALATVSVRNGPDSVDILGTIPRGTVVAVVGRNEDEAWLQIRYPPNSNLRGWVDAKFLEVTGDVSLLAIAGPGPSPSVPVPTGQATYVEPLPTATPAEGTITPVTTATQIAVETATPTAEQETPTTKPPATPMSPPRATPAR